jgi:hypothetical protein
VISREHDERRGPGSAGRAKGARVVCSSGSVRRTIGRPRRGRPPGGSWPFPIRLSSPGAGGARVGAVFGLLRKPISSHAPVLQRKRGAAQHRFPVPDVLGDVLGRIRHTAVPPPSCTVQTSSSPTPRRLGPGRRRPQGISGPTLSRHERDAAACVGRWSPHRTTAWVTGIATPDRSPGARSPCLLRRSAPPTRHSPASGDARSSIPRKRASAACLALCRR